MKFLYAVLTIVIIIGYMYMSSTEVYAIEYNLFAKLDHTQVVMRDSRIPFFPANQKV